MIKHVYFRLSSDDPVNENRPESFPDFDSQSTHIPETDPYDALLNQVAGSILDEEQEKQSITTLWPDQCPNKSPYEAVTKFSDEEQDG